MKHRNYQVNAGPVKHKVFKTTFVFTGKFTKKELDDYRNRKRGEPAK